MEMFNYVSDSYLNELIKKANSSSGIKILVKKEIDRRAYLRASLTLEGYELPVDGMSNLMRVGDWYITRDGKGTAQVVYITHRKIVSCVVAEYDHPEITSLSIIESDGRFFTDGDSNLDLVAMLKPIEVLKPVSNK